eukprot:6924409-Pyramimonas_sp.AAC.2
MRASARVSERVNASQVLCAKIAKSTLGLATGATLQSRSHIRRLAIDAGLDAESNNFRVTCRTNGV